MLKLIIKPLWVGMLFLLFSNCGNRENNRNNEINVFGTYSKGFEINKNIDESGAKNFNFKLNDSLIGSISTDSLGFYNKDWIVNGDSITWLKALWSPYQIQKPSFQTNFGIDSLTIDLYNISEGGSLGNYLRKYNCTEMLALFIPNKEIAYEPNIFAFFIPIQDIGEDNLYVFLNNLNNLVSSELEIIFKNNSIRNDEFVQRYVYIGNEDGFAHDSFIIGATVQNEYLIYKFLKFPKVQSWNEIIELTLIYESIRYDN